MNKYKLINITTKEETICDKVTIDGFDYYTSDEIIKDVRPHKGKWHIEKDYILNKFPTYLADLSECKLVIATNNPNIDLPKVVDEETYLFNIATQHSKECGLSNFFNENEIEIIKMHYVFGYQKAKETYQYTEQDMIDFNKWVIKKSFTEGTSDNTIEELLDIWKSQQSITIYYE